MQINEKVKHLHFEIQQQTYNINCSLFGHQLERLRFHYDYDNEYENEIFVC